MIKKTTSVDLMPVVCKIDKWLGNNIPAVTAFIDYRTLLPELLEVAFALTTRKEFLNCDPVGMTHWGLSSMMMHEATEVMVRSLEDYLLECLGERPSGNWHRYRLISSSTLLVYEEY